MQTSQVDPVQGFDVAETLDTVERPVDAYEIPDRHRRAVRLRTPADCFPFSSDTSARLDIDHSEPQDDPTLAGRVAGRPTPRRRR